MEGRCVQELLNDHNIELPKKCATVEWLSTNQRKKVETKTACQLTFALYSTQEEQNAFKWALSQNTSVNILHIIHWLILAALISSCCQITHKPLSVLRPVLVNRRGGGVTRKREKGELDLNLFLGIVLSLAVTIIMLTIVATEYLGSKSLVLVHRDEIMPNLKGLKINHSDLKLWDPSINWGWWKMHHIYTFQNCPSM